MCVRSAAGRRQMQKSVTASFRQTGCWCRTLRRLKAAAEHGQRPAMAERFCGKDHAGVYSSGTARAAPISTDYAARRVPSDLNEPIADYERGAESLECCS